ncbi:MAG: ATP-grasp domain-containing protein [Pseudomonadota bacterium]
MKPTVLLTLGRLPKGLDIARSFHAAGWRVVVAEPFGWHLSALSSSVARSVAVTAPNEDKERYLSDLRRLVEEENISLIVPVSEETMHVAGLQDKLPDSVALFTSNEASLLALHDKARFPTLLDEAGLSAPRTALSGSKEARGIAKAGAFLTKDRFGASGSHVAFFEQDETIVPTEGVVVQETLSGQEVASFSIVHAGVATVTVVYRPVIRDGTVATVFERIEAPAVVAYVEQLAAQTQHTGFLSLDLMIRPDGAPTAFECNPRANSGIHFLEQADIAPAVLDPALRPRLRREMRLQQAYPTLTLLWGAIGKWPRYREIGKALFSARDVTWSWRDPLPFLLMTPATWPLLKQAIFEGRSLGEAAIHDIGWFGESHKEVTQPTLLETG